MHTAAGSDWFEVARSVVLNAASLRLTEEIKNVWQPDEKEGGSDYAIRDHNTGPAAQAGRRPRARPGAQPALARRGERV